MWKSPHLHPRLGALSPSHNSRLLSFILQNSCVDSQGARWTVAHEAKPQNSQRESEATAQSNSAQRKRGKTNLLDFEINGIYITLVSYSVVGPCAGTRFAMKPHKSAIGNMITIPKPAPLIGMNLACDSLDRCSLFNAQQADALSPCHRTVMNEPWSSQNFK